MDPKYFPLPRTDNETVVFQTEKVRWFYDILHFHTAFQITHIVNGSGSCFAGDRIHPFDAGDIFVIGSQMPHVFRSDTRFYQSPQKECISHSLLFNPPLLEERLSGLPESQEILDALVKMRKGLKFRDQKFAKKIASFDHLKGFRRILELLDLVMELGQIQEFEQLTDNLLPEPPKEITYERINRVIEHVMTHSSEKIKLEEVASLVSMTPNAFCKYFKQRTRQTFIDFLNQIRINQAVQMLKRTEAGVNEIAYQCGFNNLANFNRQFSRRIGKSPGAFRSEWLKREL